MQKNINVKNVKECVNKENIYMKNYKITSNKNINKETNRQNKEKIYKNSKQIEMYIEKYLRENIKSL